MNEIQKRLIGIQQEIHAPKAEYNKFGGFAYRNAEAIYQALKPLLKKFECSLIITDDILLIGDRFYIKATATLSHNGESLSVSAFARESIDKKGMDSAQITGACSSYARKYALGGMFLIDDNKDIDSMDNSDSTKIQQPQSAQPAQPQHSAGALADISLAQQITSELRRIGLNNKQIRDYMQYCQIHSSDIETLRAWLENKDENINKALKFVENQVKRAEAQKELQNA